MYLIVLVPGCVERDRRYYHDCFQGIPDPLNLEGAEVDVFACMGRALIRLPVLRIKQEGKELSAEFHADHEAMAMIRRQSSMDRNKLEIGGMQLLLAELGIEISTEELLVRQVYPRKRPVDPPPLVDGDPPTYRKVPILEVAEDEQDALRMILDAAPKRSLTPLSLSAEAIDKIIRPPMSLSADWMPPVKWRLPPK